ncbi:hypothetical protein [Vitiosangium sp. GDMCC 1.1324]|uniref:hypothetical protein n=1 Tax=Vitiosangium sp. (strain GDMCC 1.1324) TaxID=2138576 RepID=UPI000D3479BA|nr:hypothetical protein [Vitiosangium sp. GDMCC 1.1324]PTL83149.1 hypothetical protein DAT35_14165 [Vitiosangium sp. GDMCC 1.1324]
MRRLLLFIPLALSLIACGPSHEGTVTYQVRLKPGSVTGSTIADDVHVGPDDTQWKAFLSQAQDTLGEAPSRFEVTNVRMQLDVTKSKNVGTLQEVLTGEVTAFLRASATGVQVDIADTQDPKGSAQVELDTTGASLEPLAANLAQGDFRLGLRGSTPRTSSGDFEGVITLTLDVTAR